MKRAISKKDISKSMKIIENAFIGVPIKVMGYEIGFWNSIREWICKYMNIFYGIKTIEFKLKQRKFTKKEISRQVSRYKKILNKRR